MSKIRLYYRDSITSNTTSLLSKEHTHYLTNVMRLKRGSFVNFFNKEGEWKSEIVFLEKDRVEVRFLNKVKESQKKNTMEIILQKATELGVSKFIPIISERTEVKELNYDRAKKIVIEATEQSNQMLPPEILKAVKLKDFLKNLDQTTNLLFGDVNLKDNLNIEKLKNLKSLSILIGPEGDFSPSEREFILSFSQVVPFTISKNILRSDTAVISAISLVNFINNLP